MKNVMIADEEEEVYFQFKSNIVKPLGEPVYLKDVIDFYCSEEIRKVIEEIVVSPGIEENFVVSGVQVIELIKRQIKGISVHLVGEGKTLVGFNKKAKKSAESSVTWFKVVITAILLFVGAGLAIMYFHEDVNMREVHRLIYYVITGRRVTDPLIISIPYSVGVGLGIAVFFDIFSIRKKKNKPGPLELENYRFRRDIRSYLMDEIEKRR